MTGYPFRRCRVYSPPPSKEGTWVLVDKLWPRGLKKEALALDLWLKSIAPSTPLRQWYHAAPQTRWAEFKRRYTHELHENPADIHQLQQLAKEAQVTLFYAAKNEQQNHVIILQNVLETWHH